MLTVLEGNGVGPSRQVLLDDAIELVEFVAGCRPKPHQPSLFGDFEGHFVFCGINMHASVIRPGNAGL
jgi:hypothetical protein